MGRSDLAGPWGQAGTQLIQGHSLLLPWQEGGKLRVAVAWEPVGPQPLGRSGLVALGHDNLSPQWGA